MKVKAGKSHTTLSEINVTPFVDVMLVLLIIFMVTAPMLQQGIKLSLPETRSSGTQPSKEPFILQVKKNKKIYIGTESIQLNRLNSKLTAIFSKRSNKQIYIQADKALPYGLVAKVLAEVRASGVQGINLVTIGK